MTAIIIDFETACKARQEPVVDPDAWKYEKLPGCEFTTFQLEDAFSMVQPDSHWKDPIDAVISPWFREIVGEAIVHYTGTIPEFINVGDGRLRVTSIGYRAGPCGDPLMGC